jgi:hypothetical protein
MPKYTDVTVFGFVSPGCCVTGFGGILTGRDGRFPHLSFLPEVYCVAVWNKTAYTQWPCVLFFQFSTRPTPNTVGQNSGHDTKTKSFPRTEAEQIDEESGKLF